MGAGQKVEFLETEPEIGGDGSEPGAVAGPGQLPVKARAIGMMVNDDPAEHRHHVHETGLRSDCYVVGAVHCYEICSRNNKRLTAFICHVIIIIVISRIF